MNVMVMNREQAKRFSFQMHDFQSAIISITDPDKSIVLFNRSDGNGIKFISRFTFWDEEEDKYGCISEEQAKKIADDVRTAECFHIDAIIIHCEAGKCRSAGVAAAILKALTGDDTRIFDNPQYTPNMKCYRMVLNAMMSIKDSAKVRVGDKFERT